MGIGANPEYDGRRASPSALLRPRRLLAELLALIASVGVAPALEPTTPLAELGRQSWAMENGLPQNSVHALVQTRDGFVWLGTEAGLVRFDGVSFLVLDEHSRPALPSGDIRCLLAASDGSLWIGTGEGLAQWKDGAVTVFTTANGLPANEVRNTGQNPDGSVWVSTSGGVAELRGNRFFSLDVADSLKPYPNVLFTVNLPRGGWANATATVVTIGKGGKTEAHFAVRRELPGSRIQALLADRAGALWIGTNGGLARVVDGKVQRFPVTDPLGSVSILSLLEDREGDLWVGTETGGLDILRDTRFRNIGTRDGLSSEATTTVVEDHSGNLWVGTDGGGLNVVRRKARIPGQASIDAVRDALVSNVILSLAAAPDGDVWVGTPDGLNRIHGNAVEAYTAADGLPDDFIRSLLVDNDGSLWIGTRRGLAHWTFAVGNARKPVRQETYTEANGLGSDMVGAMTRDARGNLWVATLTGLSRIAGGRITNFTTADGLSSNVVTSMLPRADGTLYVGTQDHGWSLWDGKRFTAAGAPLNQTSIHAILDDAENHLWFATASGIARCDRTATVDCAHWVAFGPSDGLRSRETATNSHPSAWRSADGHLWFATPKGLEEVDPEHFVVNTIPPPVAVERFVVDDAEFAALDKGAAVVVPAGHNHFEFDYAGLSFVAPQKVRFRYMLEGFDRGWTDAGTRRVAYYTNIPPGHYTFRVQAANNDGVWNTKGAALGFMLRPRFYQTVWFYILLALTGAALVLLLLRRRLLVAEREFKAVLGERNRIAREIHDTLAQGYVGISVQLEVLAELLRHHKVEAAAEQLQATQGHVRAGLAEARRSIWALRSHDAGEKTLPVTLKRITEQAGAAGLESSFAVHGAYRPLPPGTEREIIRITEEALHNVKKHAAARHVWVQLDYGASEISLEVRDDGRGFAANGHAPAGHYGLTGMRERAAVIGASLEVVSAPGTGASVRLRVPSVREAI